MGEVNREEVEERALAMPETAKAVTITNNEEQQTACDFRDMVKNTEKSIVDFFSTMKKSTDAAHKAVCAQEKTFLDPLKLAKQIITPKIKAWDDKQEAIRQAEERRLQEEHRKEEERKREEARKKDEEDRLAKAEKLAAEGKTREAEKVIEEPFFEPEIESSPPPTVPRTAPKPSGTVLRKYWKAKVVDEGKIKPSFMMPNMAKINKQAVATGKDTEAIVGGIEVWEE